MNQQSDTMPMVIRTIAAGESSAKQSNLFLPLLIFMQLRTIEQMGFVRIQGIAILVGLMLVGLGLANANGQSVETPTAAKTVSTIRVATFNVSLYGKRAGEIRQRLSTQNDQQAKRIASIVQTIRPDILLVNEIDFETDSGPAKLLAENYFAVPQPDAGGDELLEPIDYPYVYSAASNTGIQSGWDLDNDQRIGSGNDAWGYGVYPGQYAMAVYSRFPIQKDAIRSFQKLLWHTMPQAIRPRYPQSNAAYHSDEIWSQLRLSSKNHLDVPIQIGDHVIHLLASHPTPPVFDGPEDRNGARNHDEIEFWNRYLSNDEQATEWIVDDNGDRGGLQQSTSFVIVGDLNADPVDGSGRREAIKRLLAHRRTNDVHGESHHTDAQARAQAGQANRNDLRSVDSLGEQQNKTADFGRNGKMRVDFVIPSRDLSITNSGVFWPADDDPRSDWINASDHRMVWIEIQLNP